MEHKELILILDFGSQYTQLIARRIREAKVYSEIHLHNFSIDEIKKINPSGIILSGGPMSIYDEDAPSISKEIFELGIPVLGICYGLQLIAKNFDGIVEPAENREYGKAKIIIENSNSLLNHIKDNSIVWMSHGDYITKTPRDFHVIAKTENSPVCAISNPHKKIFGVQFHPEVAHTEYGKQIINNFLFEICGCSASWTSQNFIESSIIEIKEKLGESKALCALSGGVDSSVAAVLVNEAVKENLVCVHVDTGMMRKNESANIKKMFEDDYNLQIIHVDAEDLFLERLKGVIDPEEKRKIIGKAFIEIFESEAKKLGQFDYLVQGTLYPDVIESVSVKGKSVTIKTHHNVGGLPEKMHMKLLEPFRELFKDEVRNIGRDLGLPVNFIRRHPFPGPGLAVRVLGEITKERLDILREADHIFTNEIESFGLYDEIWQAFAVLLPVQTVGVMGDSRTYENVIALRAVTSTDGMTADWYRFDGDFLEIVSNKIIRNVRGVNRVVYDISSKPPSTIEWE
ncbi:MAG: glutamine-hydrolyzing GMP synthase [Melioribacteraceae bacterium]|nr:glutamine-hydrolyzing GMP synthase [Melioribacteraceae bacterium]MCF8353084.1 glutamine-hydrolyzing GMP synthase [Melioribacteraceae bacterium]MCF8392770.1 glutamine-hydrolyzing GMP synthase [Melioribacteraceae bacterium]MCF8418301.1 glutamine-hydrolyzing GMP synthase [Melioribacteraceae bacterium]